MRCARCGGGPPVGSDITTARCDCGEALLGSARWFLHEVICPKCGGRAQMTRPEEEVREKAPPPAVAVAARPASPLRWLFLFALLPLFFDAIRPDDTIERLERSLDGNPKARELSEEGADVEEVLAALPGGRIHGALLARDSNAGWIMALFSIAAFAVAFHFLVPPGRATRRQLGWIAAYTGTLGVFLLLSFQSGAFSGEAGIVGFLFALFYVLSSSDVSFAGTLIGNTLGVGFLEELSKDLPVFLHFRRPGSLDLRGAAAWGVASGIGFGVSEGIFYCENFYDGVAAADTYLTRFTSCVVLHGVWAGTAGILAWRHQAALRDWERWPRVLGTWVLLFSGPMLLHGLYNSFAAHEMLPGSCIVATISVAAFLWLYGRADAIERTVASRLP